MGECRQVRLGATNQWGCHPPLLGASTRLGSWSPRTRFTLITRITLIGDTTFRRIPLDKWSARCRDLATYNSNKRRISEPLVWFEPAIPASERPQKHPATGYRPDGISAKAIWGRALNYCASSDDKEGSRKFSHPKFVSLNQITRRHDPEDRIVRCLTVDARYQSEANPYPIYSETSATGMHSLSVLTFSIVNTFPQYMVRSSSKVS